MPPLDAFFYDVKRNYNLTWEALIYKDSILTIQINFTNPEDISIEVIQFTILNINLES